ncbi:MAG: TetR/AcrR family transcriptional regulator [Lachnospiraceae bacterium]|nr:TetR/AcrR family transcriptional regulator [Lachnospiraceae bacterium]
MYAKIEKTKQRLRTAMIELVDSNALENITVSQLCKQASINRSTFYKYYSVPTDILEEYIIEVYEQVFQNINFSGISDNNIYDFLLRICNLYYNDRLLTKFGLICHKNGSERLQNYLFPNTMYDNQINSSISFISGGVQAVLLQWVLSDFNETPECMAEKLTNFITKFIT